MANLSTLVDDFNDNTVGPAWAGNYGGASEAGGRARVPCSSVNYAGYETGNVWTFDSFFVQVATYPSLGGATVECYSAAWVLSAGQPAGTHVGFLADHTVGRLYAMNRVGYVDGSAPSVVLNTTAHAWLRLRLSGGNLIWETAPDGVTWTQQRTLTAPAWLLTANDCALLLESHRNDGTNDFTEFDNLNVAPFSVVGATSSTTLGGLAAAATGTRTVLATSSTTLGGLSATATGVRTVLATSSAMLGGLTAAATGVRSALASTAAALGGLTATAAGTRSVVGSTAAVLGALAVSAAGSRTVQATTAAELGGLAGHATAVGGTTHRPFVGTTTRPFAGVTTRP